MLDKANKIKVDFQLGRNHQDRSLGIAQKVKKHKVFLLDSPMCNHKHRLTNKLLQTSLTHQEITHSQVVICLHQECLILRIHSKTMRIRTILWLYQDKVHLIPKLVSLLLIKLPIPLKVICLDNSNKTKITTAHSH